MHRSTIEMKTFRPMEASDLEAIHGLSVEAGWPHRPDDWRLVQEFGHGIVATDESGRVMASAMWWPFGERFATIGMLLVSKRLQGKGIGRHLIRQVFQAAGERTIRLIATAAGQRLAEAEGFRAEAAISQFQGIARGEPVALDQFALDQRLRPAADDDWDAIATLDAHAAGVDRSVMLSALRRVGTAHVLNQEGRLIGYSICRPFGRGHVVGPLVADTAENAVALARPHMMEHAGRFLRLDTPERNGLFVEFIEKVGLANVDRVVRMIRGNAPDVDAPRAFTITNQALG